MVLPEPLLQLLRTNIQNYLITFQNIHPTLDGFRNQWGAEGDSFAFAHGFIIGDLVGSTFSTARTILGRPLDDEEGTQVNNLVRNVAVEVRDLVTRLRRA